MKKNTYMLGALLSAVLASGCATSEKTQVVQAGDNSLNCSQIKDEIVKLDKANTEVDSKKGVTGTNVAAALFFWPALAYTYIDAKDANKAISERKSHLSKLSNEKGCI